MTIDHPMILDMQEVKTTWHPIERGQGRVLSHFYVTW